MNPKPQRNYYPDTESSPYENDSDDGYDEQGSFNERLIMHQIAMSEAPATNSKLKNPMQKPTYFINLLSYQF